MTEIVLAHEQKHVRGHYFSTKGLAKIHPRSMLVYAKVIFKKGHARDKARNTSRRI